MLDKFERSARPDFNRNCTGVFQQTMGLLCAYVLCQAANNNRAIYTCHVYRHWFYDAQQKADIIQVLLDLRPLNPLPVRTRSRPRGVTSIRRDPLEFERVEQSAAIVTRSRARREAGETF